MSKVMWVITRDLINLECEGEEQEVGTASRSYTEERKDECKYKFRMSDGDDIVYFYGLSNDNDTEEAFAPLDDFGAGGYGCTNIEYWNETEKQWELL